MSKEQSDSPVWILSDIVAEILASIKSDGFDEEATYYNILTDPLLKLAANFDPQTSEFTVADIENVISGLRHECQECLSSHNLIYYLTLSRAMSHQLDSEDRSYSPFASRVFDSLLHAYCTKELTSEICRGTDATDHDLTYLPPEAQLVCRQSCELVPTEIRMHDVRILRHVLAASYGIEFLSRFKHCHKLGYRIIKKPDGGCPIEFFEPELGSESASRYAKRSQGHGGWRSGLPIINEVGADVDGTLQCSTRAAHITEWPRNRVRAAFSKPNFSFGNLDVSFFKRSHAYLNGSNGEKVTISDVVTVLQLFTRGVIWGFGKSSPVRTDILLITSFIQLNGDQSEFVEQFSRYVEEGGMITESQGLVPDADAVLKAMIEFSNQSCDSISSYVPLLTLHEAGLLVDLTAVVDFLDEWLGRASARFNDGDSKDKFIGAVFKSHQFCTGIRKVRAQDDTMREIDGMFIVDRVLFCVECKMVNVRRHEVFDPAYRREYVIEASLNQAESFCTWLIANVRNMCTVLPEFEYVVPLGLSGIPEFMPVEEPQFWLLGHVPRVVSLGELKEILTRRFVKKLLRSKPEGLWKMPV